ncbi:MAG: DUF4340 domain-containing protein [Spirochaetes bacterium]|nr:DUF4340 domain-containing protein [Spirochaetota bacterium]MBN2771629.1 DUF4340 domain-containing protein [Spirochaetota bacterium]
MNKKKLYSILTIVVLLLLIFGKGFFSGVSLPEFEKWEEDPKIVTINRPGGDVLKLEKKEGKWYINNTDMVASETEAETIISKLKTLKIFDRVSSSDDASYRYELDEEQAIRVTIESANNKLFEIMVGKQSTGMNQSYVKFVDDSSIYLAGTITPRDLRKSVFEMRSKEIARFSYRDIESFSVSYEGSSFTLLPYDEEVEAPDGTMENERRWKFKTGSEKVNMNSAIAMMNAVNPFIADQLSEEALEDVSEPLGVMEVVINGKTVTINIVKKDDQKYYYLKRADSDDVYKLYETRVNHIFRKKEALIAR